MTVDYDLVVIGASAAGIAAAKTAVRYHARVALVQQGETHNRLPACLRVLQQRAHDENPTNFSEIAQFLEILELQQTAANSLDSLAAMGIDVISESGAFFCKPRLGFGLTDRTLFSRAYLLALSLEQAPGKSGAEWLLTEMPYRLATLEQSDHIVIRGTSPESVAIAQALAKLGKQVTLVELEDTFLADTAQISAESAHRLQMHLEASGVKVISQDQAQILAADVTVQGKIGGALDVKQLNPDGLNLGAAGVHWNRERIFTDRAHRGSRKIYVTSANGEPQAIAAAHHALKLPWKPMADVPEVCTVLTNPEFVTIGLTPAQAQRRYGKIYVLEQSVNQSLKAQVMDQNAGFCQLIVRSNGQLVGAQILAPQASELVTVLSLAIQQQLSVNAIADMVLANPSLSNVMRQTAQNFRFRTRESNLWRYGLEEFFAWRRYWAR